MWLLCFSSGLFWFPNLLKSGREYTETYPLISDLFVCSRSFTLLAWIFHPMERLAEQENHFGARSNDVPISTIARGIEIDLCGKTRNQRMKICAVSLLTTIYNLRACRERDSGNLQSNGIMGYHSNAGQKPEVGSDLRSPAPSPANRNPVYDGRILRAEAAMAGESPYRRTDKGSE